MWNLDIIFVLVLAINIMKSHVAMPWEWDPFKISIDLTWFKLWVLIILILIFSFVSIKIPSKSMGFFKLKINDFSVPMLACFVACVLLPQILFWYAYPSILFVFSWYGCVNKVLKSFVSWIEAVVSNLPDFDIFIGAVGKKEDELLHEEDGIRATNLEEGISNQQT